MLLQRLLEGRRTAFVFLLLFSLAFRLYLLEESTIYPDEISWMVRGKEAVYALKQLNLEFFKYSWWNSNTENESIGLPISLISAGSLILFGNGQSSVSLNLLPDYVAGRLPAALVSSFFIPLFYLLSSYVFSKKVSLLAAILLLLDSTHIALSRWILHDAFLATCTFISVISFAIAVKKKEKYWLVISGLFLSLGFLAKPNGLLPIVSWLVSMFAISSTKQRIEYLTWGFISFLFFTLIFWPSSWLNPFLSIFEYLWRQAQLSQIGINYYFFGEVSNSPPGWFYIFQIFAKLPLLVLFCLLLFFAGFARNYSNAITKLKGSMFILSFFVFCLFFLTAISWPNIKLGARYALPLWPWIYLSVACIVISLFKARVQAFVVTMLILSSLFSALKYFPENYLYYNSFVGGPKGTQVLDTVGLCFGTKEAVEYIKTCYPQAKSLAILGCSNVVAPYYFNGRVSTDWKNEGIVIVENSFKQLLPNEESIRHFDQIEPVSIAKQKDVIVSRIYKNDPQLVSACN